MDSGECVITAPENELLALETRHNRIPEQTGQLSRWLEAVLKTGKD